MSGVRRLRMAPDGFGVRAIPAVRTPLPPDRDCPSSSTVVVAASSGADTVPAKNTRMRSLYRSSSSRSLEVKMIGAALVATFLELAPQVYDGLDVEPPSGMLEQKRAWLQA